MAELCQELHALGYEALPDYFVSSPTQLLDVLPQSWNNVEKVGDRDGSISISFSRRVRCPEKSSRQVHGPPVPGDREFATSKKPSARKGGMDSVCFTPDFAIELDEMRKMLKVMQGTREEVFYSGPGYSTEGTTHKPMGLADVRDMYVGNLLDRWRVVGRSIRSKRKECLAVDVGRRQKQHEAFLDREIQPPAEPATSGELERSGDGCDLQAERVTVAERNEGNKSAEDELLSSSSSFVGMAKEGVIADALNEETLNDGYTDGLKSERGGLVDVTGIDAGPVFTRQESSSVISPGVSYQQGGMLYPENFTTDTYKQSEPIMSEEIPLPSHQDADDNLLPSHKEAEENPAQSTKDQMLDKLSSMPKDQFLPTCQKSQDDLYPKNITDQKISDSKNHAHESVLVAQQPAECENPLDLGVPVMVRAPDQRDAGGDHHQSFLNDRSNMRIAEGPMVKKTELLTAKALKRSSSVVLKPSSARKLKSERFLGNSKSVAFSRRRNEIVGEANNTNISLGLSPIKVRDQPASALNHPSTPERSCVANGISEHRQGSHCSACSTVRNSSENNSQGTTTGSKSSSGKNLSEIALRETEASPQQKRSVTKETGAGSGSLSKRKVASSKSASAVPSGIYTPLVDPKENGVNSDSKMLLKTRRLGSSMDFASGRLTERRTPSLRQNTESSRSSGPQPGPYAQPRVSKSNSVSPYAKSSYSSRSATLNATPKDILSSPFGRTPSFTSYGSRSSATAKDTLTPGKLTRRES